MRELVEWIQAQGSWASLLFVLAYILCAVLLIPCSLLTLAIGAIYGVTKGFLLVTLSANLASLVAFLLGRRVLRGWVARKLESKPRFAAIDQAVGREGGLISFLLRLSPVFPYGLLNYALGLTRVPLGSYLLATALGMIPGTMMYVYLGSLAGYSVKAMPMTTGQKVLYGVGLVATILVTILITRLARKALAAKLESSGPAAS